VTLTSRGIINLEAGNIQFSMSNIPFKMLVTQTLFPSFVFLRNTSVFDSSFGTNVAQMDESK